MATKADIVVAYEPLGQTWEPQICASIEPMGRSAGVSVAQIKAPNFLTLAICLVPSNCQQDNHNHPHLSSATTQTLQTIWQLSFVTLPQVSFVTGVWGIGIIS